MSAFDRPVSRVLVGANPWPYARAAMAAGCEVVENDATPDDRLYVFDLAALDRMREQMLDPPSFFEASS